MASIVELILLFVLLAHVFIFRAMSQESLSNLTLNSSLSPSGNSSLLSPSGLFAFGFFPLSNDAFNIAIWYGGLPPQQRTVVWTANRNDAPASVNDTLSLSANGGLVWRRSGGGGQEKFINGNITGSAAVVSLLDLGNLVLYNAESEIIWQSFENPTNTLLPGQLLRAPGELISSISETNYSEGKYRIKMQNDGNIVMYPVGTIDDRPYAYWGADTNFVGSNATLTLDENGRLYMINSTGVAVKNVTNGVFTGANRDTIYRATMDADGLFRIYTYNRSDRGQNNGNWSVVRSIPNSRCDPKGICGVNAYCVLKGDLQPDCVCLSGFVFVDGKQKSFGCVQNFAVESCVNESMNVNYSIQELENTEWEDSSYSYLSPIEKEGCERACLEDCKCGAAMFTGNACKMQKLPLRFGKISGDESVLTLVKVGDNLTVYTKGSNDEEGQRMDILIIGVSFIAFASLLLVLSVLLVRGKFQHFRFCKEALPSELDEGNYLMVDQEEITLRSFSYRELELATNGFVEQLGKGAFGTVFKGTLPNGQRAIAVKRLEKLVAEGEAEFRNEMRSIGRIHHRNLLRLLGYCHEGSNRLLVYDYMSNGSLNNFLFKSEKQPNWDERVEIALGIARGILYLHEECEHQIIHCDINPNNILIDESHSPKIADFGLAKLMMADQTRTVTGIKGTRGFIAPEWHKNYPITTKADVYSFGIVLLVIICCRRSVDVNVPEREAILADWVYECFKGNKVRNLVQDEGVDEEELERMVRIGLWCIQEEPTIRPAMKKVVAMFEGTVESLVPPDLMSTYNSISSSHTLAV